MQNHSWRCDCTGAGTDEANSATAEILREAQAGDGAAAVAAWQGYEVEGVSITHKHPVTHLTWHSKGDYFASVAPTGQLSLVCYLLHPSSNNPSTTVSKLGISIAMQCS